MNIVKTNILILTLGLSLAAGNVKADPLCNFVTEADLVKNLSIGELLAKLSYDRTVRSFGGPAGYELATRAITAAVRGAKIGAIASLAFIKKHPYITGITSYLVADLGLLCICLWSEAKKNKENKLLLERQLAELEKKQELASQQEVVLP